MGEFWQGGVVGFMDEGEHMINTNMNAETYYFQTLESFLPTLHNPRWKGMKNNDKINRTYQTKL